MCKCFLHIDQVVEFFQESVLSVLYSKYSFKMGYTALSNLLHDLGLRGMPVKIFEQSLIDICSRDIAIDGHVIRSCSQKNDLAKLGYKMKELKASQINVLIAYDIQNHIPLLYRTYRGLNVDKKSVEELLMSRSFTNTKLVVDRGFFSETSLRMMSENENCYIIPLATNNKNVKTIKKDLQYTSGEFIYRNGKNDSARIMYYEEWISNKTRIIVYKDVEGNNSIRKSCKHMMALGENNYTQENYESLCDWWGVYFLQTTTSDTAEVVFSDYKGRWSIETYNNYVKNDADFNDLKNQNYYVQHGFDFIMLVTGLIHTKLNSAVRSLNKSNISAFDLLIKAGHMRMVLQDNKWVIHNTRTTDLDLLKAVGFVPDHSILM